MASADARADAGSWVQLGPSYGEGENASFAFDPANNQPVVAYSDSTQNGRITVKRFTGTDWAAVGPAGFSEGWPANTSLAFDPASGQPYVAYGGGGNPGGKLTVKRFDGARWIQVGTAAGFYGAFGSKLAFDPATGQPVVAYINAVFGGWEVTVIRFDGQQWVPVGPVAGRAQGYLTASLGEIELAFEPAGRPVVAYQEEDGARATVKRFDGNDWVSVGPAAFSGTEVDELALAFDPQTGQPVLAYHDHGSGGVGPFQLLVRRFTGTEWASVGPALAVGAEYVTLAFDPATAAPYVAYDDVSNSATVKRFDGTAWVDVGEPGFTAHEAVGMALTFDLVAARPHVAVDFWNPAVWQFEGTGVPSEAPKIVRTETFREGVLVFFRVFYADANDDASEFGFRGVNGSGWAEETHPFTAPSYGRVFPGRVEYPFNHGCGTGAEMESDVAVWIGDRTGLQSPPVTVHLACSAPGAPAATTQAMRGKARQWQARSLQVK